MSFLSASTTSWGNLHQYQVTNPSLGPTLMIIISLDWNRVGFAAGSSTVDEDWNDWNNPAISRDRAKLFLKRTWIYNQLSHLGV